MNFENENKGGKGLFHLEDELLARLNGDEFIQDLREFVAGTDALAADLGVISSYGFVHREGSDSLVLIDYGITQDIYATHYRKAQIHEEEIKLNEIINCIKLKD